MSITELKKKEISNISGGYFDFDVYGFAMGVGAVVATGVFLNTQRGRRVSAAFVSAVSFAVSKIPGMNQGSAGDTDDYVHVDSVKPEVLIESKTGWFSWLFGLSPNEGHFGDSK